MDARSSQSRKFNRRHKNISEPNVQGSVIRIYLAPEPGYDAVLALYPVQFEQSIPFPGDSYILTIYFPYGDIKLLGKFLAALERLSRLDPQNPLFLFQSVIVDIVEVDLFQLLMHCHQSCDLIDQTFDIIVDGLCSCLDIPEIANDPESDISDANSRSKD